MKQFIESNINLASIDDTLRELLKNNYCFKLFNREQKVEGYFFYDELPNIRMIVTLRNKNEFTQEKIQEYQGDKLLFVVGEDARVFQLLNPEKRFRENLLLSRSEKIDIRRKIDELEIIFGESNFPLNDDSPDKNLDE